jgi:hypothetical protein
MSVSFPKAGIYGLDVGRTPRRTPWSARVPLDPLFGLRRFRYQGDEASAADQGVRPTSLTGFGKTKWHCA